jgi:hypothetical protein
MVFDDELGRIKKEAVVAYFKLLSYHWLGEIVEKHENLRSGCASVRTIFEFRIIILQRGSAKHFNSKFVIMVLLS